MAITSYRVISIPTVSLRDESWKSLRWLPRHRDLSRNAKSSRDTDISKLPAFEGVIGWLCSAKFVAQGTTRSNYVITNVRLSKLSLPRILVLPSCLTWDLLGITWMRQSHLTCTWVSHLPLSGSYYHMSLMSPYSFDTTVFWLVFVPIAECSWIVSWLPAFGLGCEWGSLQTVRPSVGSFLSRHRKYSCYVNFPILGDSDTYCGP